MVNKEEKTIGTEYGKDSLEIKEDSSKLEVKAEKDASAKMESFLGINAEEKHKIDQLDDEMRKELLESAKLQFRVWFNQYKHHLRSRVVEFIDAKDWKAFGVLPEPKSDFNYDLYAKNPDKYEKMMQDRLARFIDPKFGGNKLKYEARLQHDRNLTKHRAKFQIMLANCRKQNIPITLEDLK